MSVAGSRVIVMMEEEYQLDYFKENGFVRRECERCGSHFWTTDPERVLCGDPPCVPYTFIGNPILKEPMSLTEMREAYLGFFERHGHERVERYPVIPRWRNDIYLTIASIADFQPYVTSGQVPPPANPLTISQPCIRLNDLDSVGRTGRHLTAFEMMAHHAFNKPDEEVYWKDRTVELCTDLLNELGVDTKDIVYKEEPWAGGGNAGPCVEALVGGLELGTLVFMDLEVHKEGDTWIKGEPYRKMDDYIVDTGYGLERFVWASKGTPNIYDAIFPEIVQYLMDEAGIEHSLDDPEYREILGESARLAGIMDVSGRENKRVLRQRVAETIGIDVDRLDSIMAPVESVYAVADHSRCLAFMLGDGIVPSNVKAGYLARLVLRRTMRLMRDVGIRVPLAEIVARQVDRMDAYPEFEEQLDRITEVVSLEEERYRDTLKRGRRLVHKTAEHFKEEDEEIPLPEVVKLYDTHGIPPEMTQEVAQEEGVAVELPDNFYSVVAETHSKAPEEEEEEEHPFRERVEKLPDTQLLFYDEPMNQKFEAVVLDVLERDDERYVVLEKTMFYPEGGGQPSDTGFLSTENRVSRVEDVEMLGGVVLHRVEDGVFRRGDMVQGRVDWDRRMAHARHHTTTHIIAGAARKVLGEHVWQAGAQKSEDRARLDITHYKRLTQDEIDEIELIANQTMMRDEKVACKWMDRNEAEETYGFQLYQGGVPPGARIRVVRVDGDVEACAGTHLTTTGQAGPIKILRTERIQDGVERIEFASGESAVHHQQRIDRLLRRSADVLSIPPEQLPDAVQRFFTEWKQRGKEIERLQEEIAELRTQSLAEGAEDIDGLRVIAKTLPDAEMDELVKTATELGKQDDLVAILASDKDGAKAVVSAGQKAIDRGVLAGDIVRRVSQVLGGGGGGRPEMAQGGGPQGEKITEALSAGKQEVREKLRG